MPTPMPGKSSSIVSPIWVKDGEIAFEVVHYVTRISSQLSDLDVVVVFY